MFRQGLSGCFLSLAVVSSSVAQSNPNLAGDYAGTLMSMHITLHLIANGTGGYSGTVDNSSQGVYAMPCSDIQVNGQALSFNVPSTRATWTGVVSGDGTTLTGVLNQGRPMALNLTRVAATATSAAGPSAASFSAAAAPKGDVTWDDYTFKFDATGRSAQVLEGGKLVGMIHTMNGEQQVMALPGTDADKLKKSFADYKAFSAANHSETAAAMTPASAPAAAPAAVAAPSPTPAPMPMPGAKAGANFSLAADMGTRADPSTIRFDGKTITVPRPNGLTVTFVDQDVQIANARMTMATLRHQKGTPGRFMEGAMQSSSRGGGSISGGGEEFLEPGGGILYDSGMGYNVNTVQESPISVRVKNLAQVAVAAVDDVRQVPGHEKFTPPGYSDLKEISQWRLRADGSR
jgi:hypothetical protein